MKKSSAPTDNVPQCALNQQNTLNSGNSQQCNKGENLGKTFPRLPANRGSGSNLQNVQRHIKQEPQYSVSQEWPNTYDNSNPSWECEWPTTSSTPFAKQSLSGSLYKQRNTVLSYHSSSNDWSTGESSTSSSAPSGYAGMQATQQSASNSLSASSSSYYENNNFYGGGYNYDSNVGRYGQPSYRGSHQTQQYHQSVRGCDAITGSYNGNRNPSSCPPSQVKHPVPDYSQRNSRYGMDGMFNRVQIKKEAEDYTEGENFTSLFTKSLTSLYSEDPDNAYREDKQYDPDVIVCSPPPTVSNMDEHQNNYQRLVASGAAPYNPNLTAYQNSRNSGFNFYEGRNQNAEPATNVVELGAEGGRTNSFRYDRPSFDDMHLYASPNDSKGPAKKRKFSMANAAPEGNFGTDTRRKAPRMSSFKSDSQWTPNSFGFNDIQIKQEPEDDYPSMENENQNAKSSKDTSLNSNGNCNNKSPVQQLDQPKSVPRKRSPAITCFDRFEKKSTPTNKKVSPLSVYAKVQDSVVLNVKCRRYKKRTKPIVNKEEVVYPGREEIENWKRTGAYSQTPDHAVRILMGELLERISQSDGKNVINGPDLMELDPLKIRELLFQFCQRYSIDFRDFEDLNSVLKPRIVKDKMAKNSERASAIRKRTSLSPAHQESEIELESKNPKKENVSKKANNENLKPAAKRILRNLPGREQMPDALDIEIRPSRRRSNKTPVVRRRYSTRNAKDENVDDRISDVDIVIDSSTDRESEAGKVAEVRKKSERLKNKQPVIETPAKIKSSDKIANSTKECKKVESLKSKEKNKEIDKSKNIARENQSKRWSRDHSNCSGVLRSASIEIVDITRSDSSSPSDLSKDMSESDLPDSTLIKDYGKRVNKRLRNSTSSLSKERSSSKSSTKDCPVSNKKNNFKNQDKTVNCSKDNQSPNENNFKSKKEIKLSRENIKKIDDSTLEGDTTTKNKRAVQNSKDDSKKSDTTRQSSSKDRSVKQKGRMQLLKNEDTKVDSATNINDDNISKQKGFQVLSDKKIDTLLQSDTNSDKSKLKKRIQLSKDIGKRQDSHKQNNLNKDDLKQNNLSKEHLKQNNLKDNLKQKDCSNIGENDKTTLNLPKSKTRKSVSNDSNATVNKKKLEPEFDSELKSVKKNSNDREFKATECEKLSALLGSNKSNIKSCYKNSDKNSFEELPKKENDNQFPVLSSIKKEPLSPTKKSVDFPIKKRDKSVMIAVNKPNVIDHSQKSFQLEPKHEEAQNKVANNSAQLPKKKLEQRQRSQHSDPEPQVVLRKLPDVHINSTMSSIPLEYLERYVSNERNRSYFYEDNKSKSSDDNSSVGSPPELVCMKEIDKLQYDETTSDEKSSSKMNFDQKEDSLPLPLIHCDAPMTCEVKISIKKEKEEQPQRISEHRYSVDSEDSECGLVIDLDRRMSVEEETPGPSHSYSDEETKELIISKGELKQSSSDDSLPEETTKATVITNISFQSEHPSNDLQQQISSAECIDTMTLGTSKYTNHSSSGKSSETTVTAEELKTEAKTPDIVSPPEMSTRESTSETNSSEEARVESVLRSLLLERTSDRSTGPSQPSTSTALPRNSKTRFPEDVRQFLMNQERQESLSSDSVALDAQALSDDVQATYDDMKFALDQLPNINATLLSDNDEWVYDTKLFKDKLERLKHEIMYLQCVAYQKEKERIGMICLKRYMEEVMKRMIKKHHIEKVKCEKPKNGEPSCSYQTEPSTFPDFQSNNVLCRHLLQMASIALSIAKTGVAAAIMASQRRSPNLSAEQLPPVETMVASASENYGVDLRIVKSSPTPRPTILEQVLSSKEPVYNQTTSEPPDTRCSEQAIRSSQKTPESFQKIIPSSGESSFRPFRSNPSSELQMTEAPLHETTLQKGPFKESNSNPSSSQTSLTQQPEIKTLVTSPFSVPPTDSQEDCPLDFSLERKSAPFKSSDISPGPSKSVPEKSKSKSSLKHQSNTTYSVWKKSQAARSKSTTPLDRKIDTDKAQETVPRTTSTIISSVSPSCSSSQNIITRPSSVKQPVVSPQSILHQQRPSSAVHPFVSSNHPNQSSEFSTSSLHPQRSESVNPDERLLRGNVDQLYSRNIEGEHRALSYSSLATTSSSLSNGVHAQNITPTIAIARPPGMMTPNGSPYPCNGCGTLGAKFLCSGCRLNYYCSVQCQNMQWPEHRQVCPGYTYTTDDAGSSCSQNSTKPDQ